MILLLLLAPFAAAFPVLATADSNSATHKEMLEWHAKKVMGSHTPEAMVLDPAGVPDHQKGA